MITRKQLIEKYTKFFESKGHRIIPSASLLPENDPTVLFTTAGMHPLVPYLLGEKHPLGKRLTDVQKCIRTGDIEEVGDSVHHTFFEMLGNWSLGDYFKKEAIEFSFEFLIKELKIPLERFAVTVFAGDKDCPKETESFKIWNDLGVSENRIAYLPKENNWWGPAGTMGPCGPDTEMFYWTDNKTPAPEKFNPDDKRWVEIWNDVLMGYVKTKDGKYVEARQKNIDTGMGVERTVAVLNGLEDNYLADMWKPIIEKIESLSSEKYSKKTKEMRIIADHIKAAVFIIGDGVVPGNSEQGYVLRRLIRRAIRILKKIGVEEQNSVSNIAEEVIKIYSDYSELKKNKEKIIEELNKEQEKFEKTLSKGLAELEKIAKKETIIDGKNAFLLYQSYGFPIEIIEEIAKEKNLILNKDEFLNELKSHQELSRTASAGRFKAGLADDSVSTTRLHTATHLLLQSLKIILKNPNIEQRGSNITPDRLRFDFTFERKLTEEEIKKIEDLVNAQIQSSCEVVKEEMSPEKAKTNGACGIFDKKYGEIVSVYSIGKFSKEICCGPHVKNTCELGHFKIQKEESSSSGVRRIKAVLE